MNTSKKVWVNGTFDVLHRGHLELLNFAAQHGIVRVGIDLDIRVKQLKGDSRPVNKWEDRAYFMSNISCVDSIVGFDSDASLVEQIKQWSPDYLIVGSDYMGKYVIGSEYADQVIFFDKIDGYSSTKIINYGNSIR